MRRFIGWWALAVLFLPACIEFESQVVLLRFDREADEIRMRLVYRGLSVEDEDDRRQLREIAEHEDFFCVLGWPFTFDLTPTEDDRDSEFDRLFLPHLGVVNGTFFLDAEGRPCAWQDVTVREAGALLRKVNAHLHATLLADPDALEDFSPATRERARAWAEAGRPFLGWDDRGLWFRAPAAEADARAAKEGFFRELGEGPSQRAGRSLTEAECLVRILARNRYSWNHVGDVVEQRLDEEPGAGYIRVEWWNGDWRPGLRDEEHPLPAKLDRELTPETVETDWIRALADEEEPK